MFLYDFFSKKDKRFKLISKKKIFHKRYNFDVILMLNDINWIEKKVQRNHLNVKWHYLEVIEMLGIVNPPP